MRFLAVLQVSPEASPENINVDLETEDTVVRAGSWIIRAELNAQARPAFTIQHESGSTVLTYDGSNPARLEELVGGTRRTTLRRINKRLGKQDAALRHFVECRGPEHLHSIGRCVRE